jgi:hypothetical protein
MKVNLILIHYRTIQPMRSNLKRQVFAGLTRTFIDKPHQKPCARMVQTLCARLALSERQLEKYGDMGG